MISFLSYRSRLMTARRAEAFARCLRANRRFRAVTVERSPLAAGPAAWLVRWHPVSPARCRDLRRRAQEQRAARAPGLQVSGGPEWFTVTNPETGAVYYVTAYSCTCPDFEYRCRESGLACKHIAAVNDRQE